MEPAARRPQPAPQLRGATDQQAAAASTPCNAAQRRRPAAAGGRPPPPPPRCWLPPPGPGHAPHRQQQQQRQLPSTPAACPTPSSTVATPTCGPRTSCRTCGTPPRPATPTRCELRAPGPLRAYLACLPPGRLNLPCPCPSRQVLAAIDSFAQRYPMYRCGGAPCHSNTPTGAAVDASPAAPTQSPTLPASHLKLSYATRRCGPEKGAILEQLVARQRPAVTLELGTFMG